MQIHIVQEGDTIFSIANTYRVAPDEIIHANELETPNELVIGQALAIPIVGQFYTVQRGESVDVIAQRFHLTAERLASVNQIPIDATLREGIQIYIPKLEKQKITTFAYVEPLGEMVSQSLINATQKNSPYLSYLALFSFRVNRDGTLNHPPLGPLKDIAREHSASLSLVVTNLEGDSFNSELARIIVTVNAVQNTLLDEVIAIALEGGYRDVHFDFEFLPTDAREAYNDFLRKAKKRLSQAGLLLSTALAPKTSATQKGLLYEAHDYKAHGEICDFVVLMTYEWGYSAGPPLPVSPINEVEKVVQYALTEIPAEKILLGQNLYGYDWTLPFVAGESFAKALSPQQAIALARRVGATIKYDETAQAPFFTYYDQNKKKHEVWFEDARSIQAKFNLIKKHQLLGIAYWKLGLSFPQNWVLLQNNFMITKQ